MERKTPVLPLPPPRRGSPRGIVLRRPSPQRRNRGDGNTRRSSPGAARNRREGRDSLSKPSTRLTGGSGEFGAAGGSTGDENAAQQQAVLESLASYLEGELMVRLQSYSELLTEVETLNKERLFYHGKLSRMEKVCERAQPYAASVPMVECVQKILAATTDRPDG